MNNKEIVKTVANLNKKILLLQRIQGEITSSKKSFYNTFKTAPKDLFDTPVNIVQSEIDSIKKQIQNISKTIEIEPKLDVRTAIDAVLDAWNKRKVFEHIYNWEDESSPNYNEDSQDDLQRFTDMFNNEYGINLSPKDMTKVQLSIDSNSRSELWLVQLYLAPGFSYASFDTGKVGWDTPILLNSKFLGNICAEVSSNLKIY